MVYLSTNRCCLYYLFLALFAALERGAHQLADKLQGQPKRGLLIGNKGTGRSTKISLAEILEVECSSYRSIGSDGGEYALALTSEQGTEVLQLTDLDSKETFWLFVEEVVLDEEPEFQIHVRTPENELAVGKCSKIQNPEAAPPDTWIGKWRMAITLNKDQTLNMVWARSLEFPMSGYASSLGHVMMYQAWDNPNTQGILTFSQDCCILPTSRTSFAVYRYNISIFQCEEYMGDVTNYYWDGNQWYDKSVYIRDNLAPLLACFTLVTTGDGQIVAPRVWSRLLPFPPGSAFIRDSDGCRISYRVTNADDQWWDNFSTTIEEGFKNEKISISSVSTDFYVQDRVDIIDFEIVETGSILRASDANYTRLLPLIEGNYTQMPTAFCTDFDPSVMTLRYVIDFDPNKTQAVSHHVIFFSDEASQKIEISAVNSEWFTGIGNDGQQVAVYYFKKYMFESSISFANVDGVFGLTFNITPTGTETHFQRVLDLPMGRLYTDVVTTDKLWYWFDPETQLQQITVFHNATGAFQKYAVQSILGTNTIVRGPLLDVQRGIATEQYNYTRVTSTMWVETEVATGFNRSWTLSLGFGMGRYIEVYYNSTAVFDYVLDSAGLGTLTLAEYEGGPGVSYNVEGMEYYAPEDCLLRFGKLIPTGSFTLRLEGGVGIPVNYSWTGVEEMQLEDGDDGFLMNSVNWTFENGTSRYWVLAGDVESELDALDDYEDHDNSQDESVIQAAFLDAASTLRLPISAYTANLKVLPTRPLIVCATQNPPLSQCHTSKYGKIVASGLFPSVWEAVTEAMQLQNDYEYKCVEHMGALHEGLRASLREDSNEAGRPPSELPYCHIAVGGLEYVTEGLNMGIRYSVPVYNSGFRILVVAEQKTSGLFSFLRPFTWDLWLLIVLTPVLLGVIIYVMEGILVRMRVPKDEDEVMNDFVKTQWLTASMFFGVDAEPRSLGTYAMVLGLGFVVVVVTAAFTANTAAYMTQKSLITSINSIEDISGRVVATPLQYIIEDLRLYQPKEPILVVSRTENHEEEMLDRLEAREFDALVVTAPYAADVVKQRCKLVAVGDMFLQRPLSIAFNRWWFTIGDPTSAKVKMSYETAVATITSAIVHLQETEQLLTEEQNKMQAAVEDQCTVEFGSEEGENQIGVREMAGLWLILCCCVLIGLLLTLIHVWWHRRIRQLKRKKYMKRRRREGTAGRHVSKIEQAVRKVLAGDRTKGLRFKRNRGQVKSSGSHSSSLASASITGDEVIASTSC